MDKEIVINIDRYTDLIQKEQKYYQYKNSLIENTNSNQITKMEKVKVYGFGFFLYDILNKFSKICENRNDIENYENFNNCRRCKFIWII